MLLINACLACVACLRVYLSLDASLFSSFFLTAFLDLHSSIFYLVSALFCRYVACDDGILSMDGGNFILFLWILVVPRIVKKIVHGLYSGLYDLYLWIYPIDPLGCFGMLKLH